MGRIEAICTSSRKGVPKTEVTGATLVEGWGVEGDAHAGDWHRQVSLLAGESIDRVRELIPSLEPGAFAENIVTRGIDLSSLRIGDRLALGDTAVLSITQIGKECHAACAIREQTGDCIMPREGLFAEVVTEGAIEPGDSVRRAKTQDRRGNSVETEPAMRPDTAPGGH